MHSAIGTTYSLDLTALLSVPLALTYYDWEDERGRPSADPVALLEALRQHAGEVTVFCQAGQIHVPRRNKLLYGYVEESVVEVTPPRENGVFHPKVWVLRFLTGEQRVLYRLICMSRNLTFDRSWDTMLVLDGQLMERRNAYAANHPLADFLAALPSLALREIPEAARARVRRMENEIRRVRWALPEGFGGVLFHPLGIAGYRRSPFKGRIDRLLVVSPFLSPKRLRRCSALGENNVLISRLESLAAVDSDALEGFAHTYFLNPAASMPEQTADGEDEGQVEDVLNGLHAKLFVAEAGWDARVWVGSANATDAAFGANVEFLTELVGRRSQCGIEALLGQDGNSAGFRRLLQQYTPDDETPDMDTVQQELEGRVNETRAALSTAGLLIQVEPTGKEQEFRMALEAPEGYAWKGQTDLTVRCWPVTLQEGNAKPLVSDADCLVRFGPIACESLTGFFAFEVKASSAGGQASARFVLNLPLRGAPESRRQRILRALLRNRRDVLRFLLFLLAEASSGQVGGFLSHAAGSGPDSEGASFLDEAFLFESLLRTLDRAPEKLRDVARLVDELKTTPDGVDLLPDGFDAIWAPIRAAWQEVGD